MLEVIASDGSVWLVRETVDLYGRTIPAARRYWVQRSIFSRVTEPSLISIVGFYAPSLSRINDMLNPHILATEIVESPID